MTDLIVKYLLFIQKAIPNWQISYHNFFVDELIVDSGGVTGSATCTAATIQCVVVVVVVIYICYRICDYVTVDITDDRFVV